MLCMWTFLSFVTLVCNKSTNLRCFLLMNYCCTDDVLQAGEQMKLEYQRKVASLTKLKKRDSNTEALERMKAAVSHLHTRYIVDMQSMDSTVSEINRLRDDQLYPKLVALVDG